MSHSTKLSVISSIKCSSCGKAIPITSLTAHVCDASLEYSTPAPPPKSPFKLDLPKYETSGQSYGNKNLPFLPTPSDSIWNNRPLPPRINPDFANELYSDTPPYSAGGSSDSSRDGRSASPLTPSTQITSPGLSYFARDKVSRTPSPPSLQNRDSPSKMALDSISENPPPVPSKMGTNVFQRLNAGVNGPFSKGVPGRRGPGLPSSPSSNLDRKPKQDSNKDEWERRTPGPINETLMALNGRRPSVDQVINQERSKGLGSPSWDKPLPNPAETTSHKREESNKSLGPSFEESKYVPWWLKDSNSNSNSNNNIKKTDKDNESVQSWERPLPPLNGSLRTIDESPQSRPKTANPDSERRRNPFGLDRSDPAIQYGLDDSSKPRNNSSHLHSSSDPEHKAEQNSRNNKYRLSNDNPFSSSYSPREKDQHSHQHSHQHSQQSFSSSSSHKHVPSPASQSPSSNASPERNWSSNKAPTTMSTSANKHTCRGCSHVIHGRSLVDSSRRLTGRYHKECFVCTDCRAPFPSGEFYVLDNLPYCAFDYHKKNKSLCHGCGVGVEGSYLQTDGDSGREGRLWHLECFKCAKCSCVLREEYWELDGKALCTRHAFPNGFGSGQKNSRDEERDGLGVLGSSSSLAPGSGGRNPERRRTKLFMGSSGTGLGMSGFGETGMGAGYGRNMNPPPRRW